MINDSLDVSEAEAGIDAGDVLRDPSVGGTQVGLVGIEPGQGRQ